MNLSEVIRYYKTTIENKYKELANLNKKLFITAIVRLIIFVFALAVYYLFKEKILLMPAMISGLIILFFFFLKYNNILTQKKQYTNLLIKIIKDELNGINYDFSAFDGAPERIDNKHNYSLDLDFFGDHSFFQSINRSVTDYGKNMLINTLLSPYTNRNDIEKRQEAIKELSRKPELMIHFRCIGQMEKPVSHDDIEISISKLKQSKQINNSKWKFMPYISIFSFLLGIFLFFSGKIPASFIAILWGIMFNISLVSFKYINVKINNIEKNIKSQTIYLKLFRIIENEKFESGLLKELQKGLKINDLASHAIHLLKSRYNNLGLSYSIIGILFLNPLIFWNIIHIIMIEKWIGKYDKDVKRWLDILSSFDSLISFGTFAYNHPDYIYPEISDSFIIKGENMGHPMLDYRICVPNDVSITTNPYFLVITGANMAGKSTYLRTIGINLILACTGAPVCASSFIFYPSKLITSLRTSDSLTNNESYFFAELKRLKMIIDNLQSEKNLFIILDEILKGTNSRDKLTGSIALVKQFLMLGGNGIIATHDTILGELENEYPNQIKNYRFEAEIKNDQLIFPYKMQEGIAKNMNACFLMKKIGIIGI